jgi:hypothetical protein
MGIRKKP